MTELCRYPIINTGLKNDLIIEVFWTHEEIKDRGYYIVFSGGNGNSLLEESNIRGH